ncbi:TAXI family TRAP transporter solute-binding subunit [Leptolyngbya sp. DQ-M1]|uniref:TAXI family TRAP transporter solute-binding subunit n=1 Tax=Leptolyngbya sp. DQ-M1 TaxID=2933920 RepID=UPI0032983A04
MLKLQFLSKLMMGCAVGVTLLTSGCARSPKQVALSSGTSQGYYSRLAEQIRSVTHHTVQLKVENRESQGSIENLRRLLDRQVDFALVQLDVVSNAMSQGKVQAVAILANEPIHIIASKDAKIRSFSDLNNKRVGVGSSGSGIRYTSEYLIRAFNLKLQKDSSSFDETFRKLSIRQLDAGFYVGTLGASERLRQELIANSSLQLVSIEPERINYLTNRDPGAYQSTTIPQGVYNPRPVIPSRDISTLATATVLVTRPDVSTETVGLLTWAILYNSRRFSLFYPDLQTGEARSLLQRNLLYVHPGAQNVYAENADPRNAWLRYLEANSDLQAGLVILFGTSGIGLIIQRWRRDRSKKFLLATITRTNELKQFLPHNPQQALEGIEDLSQEHRLMFIDGSITSDAYEQVQHKTQTFAVQCRTILEQQRKQFVLNTLLVLDDWQASLQTDPQAALQKLGYLKQQYREMLITDQVEVQAYIELMELTLLSVMTLSGTAILPEMASPSLEERSEGSSTPV